jgi:hypothetical protein
VVFAPLFFLTENGFLNFPNNPYLWVLLKNYKSMAKTKKNADNVTVGQKEKAKCITFPKNDTFFIVRSSILNVVKSLDFGKHSDFKSYGCAAALIQYFMNVHNNTLDYLDSKPSDYVVTDADFEHDCSKSYLTDVMLGEWVDKTVVKARDILVLNKIIKIRVHVTTTGRITKGSFDPEITQNLINQYGITPLTKGNNTLPPKGNNTHTKGNNTHTKGNNTHTKGNNTHISNYKEYNKESLKEVCTDTPSKKEILKKENESDCPQNHPAKRNNSTEAVVNEVNYLTEKDFTVGLMTHMMSNVETLSKEVKGFDMMRVAQYAEKHSAIVFSGKYEGLKSKVSYTDHVAAMVRMNIFSEVNVKQNISKSSKVLSDEWDF